MNAAIRAVAKVAASKGVAVWGIEGGFDGLIDARLRPLTQTAAGGTLDLTEEVENAGNRGGTLLGTARSPRFLQRSSRAEAAATVADYSLDGLIVIGGNGSLTGARHLADEHGIQVVGIPATIDNDIGLTREAIGVDTALNTVAEACDRICDTATAHRRAFIVEVMGRHSGYLAMSAAAAVGADAVLLPERRRSDDEIVQAVAEVLRARFAARKDRRRALIIKAEGVEYPTEELVAAVERELAGQLKVDVRATILGHVVRGGSPTHRDRALAGRFGLVAVEALLQGHSRVMTGWNIEAGGVATSDKWIQLFDLEVVEAASAALLDGTSQVIKERLERLERMQGVLSI